MSGYCYVDKKTERHAMCLETVMWVTGSVQLLTAQTPHPNTV